MDHGPTRTSASGSPHLLIVLVLLLLTGCKETVVSPRAAAGDQTLKVSAITYDDFNRDVPTTGPVAVTLVGDDRTVHTSIPYGSTTCEFRGLPPKGYILSAQKDGYYPYDNAVGIVGGRSTWSTAIVLIPHPSPAMRIDSIAIETSTAAGTVTIRLVTAQTAPSTYYWRAVLFFSRTSPVDPSTGAYDLEFQASAAGGNTIMMKSSVYNFFSPRGTRLYVTARLMTAATRAMNDTTRHITRYANLEENSTAAASFVLP